MIVNSINARAALGFDHPVLRVVPKAQPTKKLYPVKVNFNGDVVCYKAELNNSVEGVSDAMHRLNINPESEAKSISITVRPTLRALVC